MLRYENAEFTINYRQIRRFHCFVIGYGTTDQPVAVELHGYDVPVEVKGVKINIDIKMLNCLKSHGKVY